MSTHNICFCGEIRKIFGEAHLMSTHNICFRGEIRKLFTGYPPLSGPIVNCTNCFSFFFKISFVESLKKRRSVNVYTNGCSSVANIIIAYEESQ